MRHAGGRRNDDATAAASFPSSGETRTSTRSCSIWISSFASCRFAFALLPLTFAVVVRSDTRDMLLAHDQRGRYEPGESGAQRRAVHPRRR